MALEGMDSEAVRMFANQLTTDADQIETVVNSLTSQLHGVQWIGADASRFTDNWDSTYRPQLQAVSNALRDAASVANANVIQQEQASAS
jgi:uncharacterized protein YukE